jgi:hypothetical protein
MCRIISILLLTFTVSGVALAQPAWIKTDSVTYQLYLGKEWKSLLKETRKSLNDEVDFYYLRVRAGIAAYELKNYRLAAHHLGKAYNWNTSDEFTNYWYYHALLLASRSDEANILAQGFSAGYLHRMNIRPNSAVHSLLAESQFTINPDYNTLLGENITGGYSYMAYRNVLKQQFYKGIGIDHKVTDRLNLYHGFSHLGIKRMQMFGRALPPRIDDQIESTTSQYQYYLQGRYILDKGWSISSAVTFLWGDAVSNYFTFTANGIPFLNWYNYKIGDRFFTASIAKELVRIRPKLSFAYGSINGNRQVQANGQLVVYPMGNNHIYLTSDIALHSDESADELKTVLNQKIGIKTGPLWLIAEGAHGPMKNFASSDGYVVYNMAETVNSLYGMALYLPIYKYRLDVTARYQVLSKEGTTFDYLNTSEFQEKSYKFNDNNFLISIRWYL